MSDQKPDEVAIFAAAAELPSEAQAAFLNEACQGDRELRDRIARYLDCGEQSGPLDVGAPAIAATLQRSVITDRVGTQVGPYKLIEQIGEGGMGLVYMAEQREPVRRTVALKVIKPGMDSQQVVARFESERQALALMNHPNIAKVLDAGTTDAGLPYFVMELVKGIPITEFCDQQQLNSRQRLELFVTVCRAVQHAHQKGVIHRDLKPSNVLVELHDVTAVPKVIDFGVAKATNQQLTNRTLHTGYAQMIGTPLYMSPEQAQLSGLDVDIRSDIYSLGVLLYELLTGATPFDQETLRSAGFDEMRRIIREEEPRRPSDRVSTMAAAAISTISDRRKIDQRALVNTMRGELDWIVMKALEKDRTRRYETTAALVDDVERYLCGQSVQAVPPSTGYQLRKFAARHKTILTTASVIALALAGGIATSLWYADQARHEANAAQQARHLADERLTESQAAREDADANYQVALQTVESMLLSLVDDQIARVPVTSRNRLLTDAQRLFDQLLQYNALDTEVLIQRARVHAYLLEPQNALADYEHVLRLDPDHAQAHADLAEFLGRNLDVHYRRRKQALKHARRAVELEPDNAKFRVILALLCREDDPQQASTLLDRAIELDPNLAEAYLRRGMVRWDQGQREAARSDLERSLQLNPDFAAAVRFRAEMLAGSDRHDAALEAYTQAISLDPYSPQAYLGRASEHWQLGDPEKATQDIEAAQYLAPSFPVSYQRSAQLRTQRGQYREALEDINRQIAEQPKNVWLRVNRGTIHIQMQQYELALPDLDNFLSQRPEQYHVYKRRAVVRFHLGEIDAALNDLEKAVALNPNDPSTIRWIPPRKFLKSATPDQRQRLLRLADGVVELAPPGQTLAWALSDRATIRFAWGERQQAIADCSRALQEDPKTAWSWYQHAIAELSQNNPNTYREICAERLPNLAELNGSGAWPDYAVWTYALTSEAVPEMPVVIAHAERFLDYSLRQEQWWEDTGDIGNVWLRQQILGALLYRAGKNAAATQRLRLADVQYNHASSWPPYARFFLAMIYAESGDVEEAKRWLTLAANWSENAMKDESRFHWHHLAVLKMLRSEAETVVAKAEEAIRDKKNDEAVIQKWLASPYLQARHSPAWNHP